MDLVQLRCCIGVGGTVTEFELAENGIGYEVGDVLELTGMEFHCRCFYLPFESYS